MPLPDHLDKDKLAEAALALLGLTAFGGHGAVRAWKGFDWDLLDLLHAKGWICDPRGTAKSVLLTEDGARLAQQWLDQRFNPAD